MTSAELMLKAKEFRRFYYLGDLFRCRSISEECGYSFKEMLYLTAKE